MTKYRWQKNSGVTLVEILLVLVIIGVMLYMGIGYIQNRTEALRIDRTSMQMQQILNAALAYYVLNGSWPPNLATLQGNYLPPATVPYLSPWGGVYNFAIRTDSASPATFPPQLYVWTSIPGDKSRANALAISTSLPLAYTSAAAGSPGVAPPSAASVCTNLSASCNVVASVQIPGQNLNNARAVNFAGLYHHGACVPVPQCPVDVNGNSMTPQIMVVPVSISGVNDTGSNNVYPISSFTAYATSNNGTGVPTSAFAPACRTTGVQYGSAGGGNCRLSNNGPTASAYWRVCTQVVTERGDIAVTRSDAALGSQLTVLAITRCAVNNEPAGSNFNVFSN
jgi:prepilin-type N-terminal cleavage/methylation domain-containing protein